MSAVIWHDVECGAYAEDLALWEELAAAAPGPVLELGSGTGRVALHLAREGCEVVGLEEDGDLCAELNRRAEPERVRATAVHGDAAGFNLGRKFGLIIAPMQLVQLLAGAEARRGCLAAARAHLADGGCAAFALLSGAAEGVAEPELVPDVRESDGWIYSSRPLGVHREDGALVVVRLRQRVSPAGDLSDERAEVRLRNLGPAELETEALASGLRPAGRRAIGATPDHVASEVVLVEAG